MVTTIIDEIKELRGFVDGLPPKWCKISSVYSEIVKLKLSWRPESKQPLRSRETQYT